MTKTRKGKRLTANTSVKSSVHMKPTTSPSVDHHKMAKPVDDHHAADDHDKDKAAKRPETHQDAAKHEAKPEITEAERSRVKKQHIAELQQKQV